MLDTKTVADALGRRQIADRLGVGETAVSNAVVRGWFPATWFFVLQDMCREEGLDCPPWLFKMKGSTPNVDTGGDVQGAAE